jgi:RING finger protein 113A
MSEDLDFKKKSKKTFRKRQAEEEEDDDQQHSIVNATNLKRNKKDLTKAPEILPHAFAASGTAKSLVENTAFRTLDVDGHDENKFEVEKSTDNNYTGLKGYEEYVNKRKSNVTQSTAGQLRAGPLKGVANVRITSRFDYAPAVCKDYKETGWCGFGDSCVFVHDRTDYKMGWELDLEWEEQQRKLEEEKNVNYFVVEEEEVESDDDLPFACYICRKEFQQPVMTKCKHYFCEACAIKQFSKSPACFVCGQNTQGVFNSAKELLKKIQDKKKRLEERANQALLNHESDQESN